MRQEKFLIKLRLVLPELPIKEIKQKLNGDKYFRIKTRIDQNEKQKLWRLESRQLNLSLFKLECIHMVIYLVTSLAVDYDNFGISGEKKF